MLLVRVEQFLSKNADKVNIEKACYKDVTLVSFYHALEKVKSIYFLTECTLDYDRCQLVQALLWTTDRNDHSTKPTAYHNSEQVYEPKLVPVSSGY